MRPAPAVPRALALLALGLATCRAPDPREEHDAPVSVPASFAVTDSPEERTSLERWWEDFGDEELSRTVEQVLLRNLDLDAARARLAVAEAQARIAGAELGPSVGLGADGTRQRQNFVGLPIPGEEVLSTTYSSFGVSLNVSWELDLWGKLDARASAAEAELAAGAADFEGARLSLAGQAVKAWLALCEARLQLEVAAAKVESTHHSTEVLRGRFGSGRIPALDLRLSEVQLAAARAARSAREQTLEVVKRELEVLQGAYPAGSAEAAPELPLLPPVAATGLPSELLQRRPDLVSARETLAARDYRLYAARKELWPSLSLGASAGRVSAEVGDLVDPDFSVWSLFGNLTQPLFQSGRLEAGVDLAEAGVREAIAEYGQSLLRAFLEVESVLAQEASLARREEQLRLGAQQAADAADLAEERYLSGRADILTMLSARNTSFDSRSALLAVRRERLERRVDLFLALGGGYGEPPSERENATTSTTGADGAPPSE